MATEEFIGRSIMNCLIFEAEDMEHACGFSDESTQLEIRCIRLFFDAMDALEIKRVHPDVYSAAINSRYVDDDLNDLLNHDDDKQLEDFKNTLFVKMIENPDNFEMGVSELKVDCDMSCRGIEEIIDKQEYSEGELMSVMITTRPDNCIYKKYL